MKVKLNKIQFDYLDYNLSQSRKALRLKLQVEKKGQFIFIEVDENTADEINDWAEVELQKRGFDINYDLTKEGKILEKSIDAFYIE